MEKKSVISLKDVKKSFDDFHVLKGVNLEIEKSNSVVLLGKSGTGKSVILQIIAGLL